MKTPSPFARHRLAAGPLFFGLAIQTEPLFKKIRKAKRFKALMEKHFPAG